jgi:D-tyrosyl-tRNA(Tyr) deacylase
MRVILQRVSSASVEVEGQICGKIGQGLLILWGAEDQDDESEIDWLVNKIVNLRIFGDEEGKMNLSINDVKGSILSVSQFTLHAAVKKGNRPSFIRSASPESAQHLYQTFNQRLVDKGFVVETGIFGAHMNVKLVNDGPVTIWIDTKNKE